MEDSVLGREMVGYDYESSQKIQNLLTERLSVHISKRVDDKYQKSWVWDFVRSNLHVISATIVLTGHAKCFDVFKFCHGCNQSLLQDPCIGNVFSIGAEISKLEGCYLYWDTMGKRFIRSGKVSGGLRGDNGGRTFAHRNREHKKGS